MIGIIPLVSVISIPLAFFCISIPISKIKENKIKTSNAIKEEDNEIKSTHNNGLVYITSGECHAIGYEVNYKCSNYHENSITDNLKSTKQVYIDKSNNIKNKVEQVFVNHNVSFMSTANQFFVDTLKRFNVLVNLADSYKDLDSICWIFDIYLSGIEEIYDKYTVQLDTITLANTIPNRLATVPNTVTVITNNTNNFKGNRLLLDELGALNYETKQVLYSHLKTINAHIDKYKSKTFYSETNDIFKIGEFELDHIAKKLGLEIKD